MQDALAFLAFGPRDQGLVWIRASGAIDAVEWDPSALAYVEGLGRDGGAAMPVGFWETARLPGGLRRLVRVEIERPGFGAVGLCARTERAGSGETSSAPAGRRWSRFSPRVQGRTIRVRIHVPESLDGVAGFDMVMDPLAGPNR